MAYAVILACIYFTISHITSSIDNSIGDLIRIPIIKRSVESSSRRNRFLKEKHAASTTLDDIPSLHLSNYYNNEYVGTIGVGQPSQYLTVIFDTGSSDIWLPSKSCTTCGYHSTFDSSKSSSYNIKADGSTFKTEKSFSISYGSGKVSGIQAYETLSFGSLSLPGVIFGEVTYEDTMIADFAMDGICGLAFSGLSIVTKPTLLDSLKSSYPSLNQSFSFYLDTDPTDSTSPSLIMIGGYDLSLVSSTASFYYTPVIRDSIQFTYWSISLIGFEISTESTYTSTDDVVIQFSVCTISSCLAIVDTGTSGIGIPELYYDNVVSVVTNGLNCKSTTCIGVTANDFPVLMISLAPDNVFPLLPSDYVECSCKKDARKYPILCSLIVFNST